MDRITPKEFLERNKNRAEGEEEDKYFTDPNQILEIFSNLIEENLMFIQNIQEQEQTLEESKKKFNVTIAELDKKVQELNDSQLRMVKNINEKQLKVSSLENKLTGEDSDNFIDELKYEDLEKAIRGIYTDFMGHEEMHAEPIRMLKAIERKFMGYLSYFDEIEDASEENKKWMQATIKKKEKEIRLGRQARNQERAKEKERAKQEKYAKRAQDNAQGKIFGKPLMKKCRVPEKKKVQVEKKVDPEEQFFREFLNG